MTLGLFTIFQAEYVKTYFEAKQNSIRKVSLCMDKTSKKHNLLRLQQNWPDLGTRDLEILI